MPGGKRGDTPGASSANEHSVSESTLLPRGHLVGGTALYFSVLRDRFAFRA